MDTLQQTMAAVFVALLGLGLLAPTASNAQDNPFALGVRGGVTQATFYGDDVAQNDFRPGFTGGIFATYAVNDAFSVQPEVLYSVRGAKNHFNEAGTLEDVRVRQDVIEIPVLAKLSAPLEPVTPRLYAGPAIAFPVNNEVDGVEADDAFTDVDFSGVVGGEIAYQVGGTAGLVDEIALDGRYNLGLTDLGDLDGFEQVRTSAFTGTLSVRFNL